MVVKNTKNDLLGKEKKFAQKDTSYSSFWLYNKYGEIVDKDNLHYKILFKNHTIWVPHHWVAKKNNKIMIVLSLCICFFIIWGFASFIGTVFNWIF